jgi:hypothetical protein
VGVVTRIKTVAFQGIEAVLVDVQVQIAPGMPVFVIVGLPDKAVKESGERVRSALIASSLSLPPKRIIINLAPADLPKEGSHYDLPIALAQVLDSLRQPLEAGETVIARANSHVTFPARFQLIAAMNPCKCGLAGTPGHTCKRGDRCAADYQGRVSGPFLDRIDLRIDVPAVSAADMIAPASAEPSSAVAACRQGARTLAPALPRTGRTLDPHQRGRRAVNDRKDRQPRQGQPGPAAAGRRALFALGSGLSSRAEGGAAARRSRRCRKGCPAAHRRGAELSAEFCDELTGR